MHEFKFKENDDFALDSRIFERMGELFATYKALTYQFPDNCIVSGFGLSNIASDSGRGSNPKYKFGLSNKNAGDKLNVKAGGWVKVKGNVYRVPPAGSSFTGTNGSSYIKTDDTKKLNVKDSSENDITICDLRIAELSTSSGSGNVKFSDLSLPYSTGYMLGELKFVVRGKTGNTSSTIKSGVLHSDDGLSDDDLPFGWHIANGAKGTVDIDTAQGGAIPILIGNVKRDPGVSSLNIGGGGDTRNTIEIMVFQYTGK